MFDFASIARNVIPQFFKDPSIRAKVEQGLDFVVKSGATNDFNSVNKVIQSTGVTNSQIDRIAGYVEGFKLPRAAQGLASMVGGQRGVADKIRMFKQGNTNTKENAPQIIKPGSRFSRL